MAGTDKDNKPEVNSEAIKQEAPADALSRTPDDLAEESKKKNPGKDISYDIEEEKIGTFRRIFRKINVYLLAFLLILAVSIIFTIVLYLNSAKTPEVPQIESQELTEETLRQLANTDASVGNTSQTLTIKGNAVIDGQTLMRGNLNIAGNLQTGGSIQGPSLTISGQSNLGPTQINSLQIASTLAIQGDTTMRNLSVAGASNFSGPMTASQITVTSLTLSGNATLTIPNHISIVGPTPSRTSVASGVLGTGGSASISGSDTAGTINVNTGNNTAPGCFVSFSFNQRFVNTPRVIVSPVGQAAGQTEYYVERDTAGFKLCAANNMPTNKTFAYDYFIVN